MAKVRITLKKSPIGRTEKHKLTVKALGLGKLNSTVVHEATPQIMGMVRKVGYLLQVEEVSE